jgi:hypothetical protein|tara:strand:- start:5077 stop:5325 length:249 start_codon:yes stop_codon:yes gene_type:complete
MKTIVKHLKGGSVIEGKEIFLVAMTGKYFLELLRELDTATLVPRGNITTTPLEHLAHNIESVVSAYIFLNEEEAMLFRIKYT